MAEAEPDIRRATTEAVRWYLLRALDAGRPDPVSEEILLRTVQDAKYPLTPRALRRELDYLHERKLITVTGRDDDHWAAALTAAGIDVVEYVVECRPGIARPPRRI